MDFLFFISGALLVLISVIFGYAMGERKSDRLASSALLHRETIAERKADL
jgi:hypothetical protein